MAASTPSTAKPKDPFAVQAAKFSLYAPIVAIALGFAAFATLSNSPSDTSTQPMAVTGRMVLAIFNSVLLTCGFIAAIVAFAGIPKHGTPKILWRAIIGFVFNGFFVAGLIIFFLMGPIQPRNARFVGHWRAASPAMIADKIELQLNADGKGQLSMAMLGQPQINGKWGIIPNKQQPGKSLFVFKLDAPTTIGTQTVDLVRWEIEKYEQDTLTLRSPDGIEIYKRAK